MRISFRVDASLQMGTGHVMRCLTLADALRERGNDCSFICRPHTGHLMDLIAQRRHKVVALPVLGAEVKIPSTTAPSHATWLGTDWANDAQDTSHALGDAMMDWLIVDHYALDSRWEQAMRPSCRRLMVIDDLADRPHDCDLLLDQNLGRTEEDYCGLLGSYTTTLLGPQYALLRPEIAKLRTASLARRANLQLKRLLITMGGVDKDNFTGKVLEAVKDCTLSLTPNLYITVVMGYHAPWLTQVRQLAAQMPWPTRVLVDVNNMAQIMADSDFAVGAAGSTSWERCCLGLPTIQLVLAENQRSIAEALVKNGAALMAEPHNLLQFISSLQIQFEEKQALQEMIRSASGIVDGAGAIRVGEIVTKVLT